MNSLKSPLLVASLLLSSAVLIQAEKARPG